MQMRYFTYKEFDEFRTYGDEIGIDTSSLDDGTIFHSIFAKDKNDNYITL